MFNDIHAIRVVHYKSIDISPRFIFKNKNKTKIQIEITQNIGMTRCGYQCGAPHPWIAK